MSDKALWPKGNEDSEFNVYCNGVLEASASGPRRRALGEALHYAAQYAQDGEVEIHEILRRVIEPHNDVLSGGPTGPSDSNT